MQRIVYGRDDMNPVRPRELMMITTKARWINNFGLLISSDFSAILKNALIEQV